MTRDNMQAMPHSTDVEEQKVPMGALAGSHGGHGSGSSRQSIHPDVCSHRRWREFLKCFSLMRTVRSFLAPARGGQYML